MWATALQPQAFIPEQAALASRQAGRPLMNICCFRGVQGRWELQQLETKHGTAIVASAMLLLRPAQIRGCHHGGWGGGGREDPRFLSFHPGSPPGAPVPGGQGHAPLDEDWPTVRQDCFSWDARSFCLPKHRDFPVLAPSRVSWGSPPPLISILYTKG